MFAEACQNDHLGFGRQGLQEGPVVGGPSAIATIRRLGACSPDVCDFACTLRLQRELAALRHRGRDRGSSGACPRRRGRRSSVPQAASRQEALARPSSPGLSGTMTPSRETEAVVASCGMPSASRMLPSVSGPRSALPAFVHAHGQALQGARPTASWRRSSQRTPPLPGPCSDPSSADRARPPATASGNRRRGPGSRRPDKMSGDAPLAPLR